MTAQTELRPLTAKQRAVYRFIAAHYRDTRIPPTVRDIQRHTGVASPNGVVCHLRALRAKGWVEWRSMTARSILPTLEAISHEA